ncbi:hypothetical protein RE628_21360 [Paenibacillus sp. D2_2]|nr:hypothetical protein [Paenibacillus sp. D2_2]WMT39880.1 hypothetical protein RE628_21360 [Paenibacillus sp. D2_2]
MIEVRHIDKSYGSLSVLKDVNWQVQRGQFWGLSVRMAAGSQR